MSESPPPIQPATLKFLTRLVTVLTATMILGLLVIVALLVTRFWAEPARDALPALPEVISLPEGARATAFTQGEGWYAVVTDDHRILVYDRATGSLRQEVDLRN